MYVCTLRGSFPFDFPPKYVSKGSRFWGFRCSRVRGVHGAISLIPLDLAILVELNLAMDSPCGVPTITKSFAQIRGAIWEIGSWIWGC
jgi:hypothetical protein